MSTKEPTGLSLVRNDYQGSQYIDQMLTDSLLFKTINENAASIETSCNARSFFVFKLIYDAVFLKDVGLIDLIINRIDGIVPKQSDRDSYANIIGDALDDVLDMTRAEQLVIMPNDPAIIALAKSLIHISLQDPGNNPMKKKDKVRATEIILNRCGGKKTEPTKPLIEEVYVEPEWMQLGTGEADEQGDEDN